MWSLTTTRGSRSRERIAAVLAPFEPDVVVLQEEPDRQRARGIVERIGGQPAWPASPVDDGAPSRRRAVTGDAAVDPGAPAFNAVRRRRS